MEVNVSMDLYSEIRKKRPFIYQDTCRFVAISGDNVFVLKHNDIKRCEKWFPVINSNEDENEIGRAFSKLLFFAESIEQDEPPTTTLEEYLNHLSLKEKEQLGEQVLKFMTLFHEFKQKT